MNRYTALTNTLLLALFLPGCGQEQSAEPKSTWQPSLDRMFNEKADLPKDPLEGAPPRLSPPKTEPSQSERFANWRIEAKKEDAADKRPEFSSYKYQRKTPYGLLEATVVVRNRRLYHEKVYTLGALLAKNTKPFDKLGSTRKVL